jgi:aspartate racemase
MGPEATVDLMNRIIRATPASDDVDHIRMVVDNNPKVPSRIRALIEGDGPSPVPVLQGMARKLSAYGVDFLAMPCNTAHYYHQEVQQAVTVPLLDMVELAVQKVVQQYPGVPAVGLLASTAVLSLKIY